MKTICDPLGKEHTFWTMKKDFGDCAFFEVGTNENKETYLRFRFPERRIIIMYKDGFEYNIILTAGFDSASEKVSEMLSFAGAALKELMKASAALEEHLK